MILLQHGYGMNYDRNVRFATNFRGCKYVFLDMCPLFLFAAQHSASEGYNKRLCREHAPYKVISVDDNTLQIVWIGLQITIPIRLATLKPTSRQHCDANLVDRNAKSSEEVPSLDLETDEHRDEDDNTYVFNKIARRIGSRPRHRFVVRL